MLRKSLYVLLLLRLKKAFDSDDVAYVEDSDGEVDINVYYWGFTCFC